MTLSVIIVNHNSGALAASCIGSVQREAVPNTEIIVVDNASADDSVPFLSSDFPDLIMIANDRNRGFGAAVNQGIRRARGECYLVLNPDIIALPGSIRTLVKFMVANPCVGLAGGKLIYPNGKLQPSCFRFYTPWTVLARRTALGRTAVGRRELDRFVMKDFDHAENRDVEWLMGSCLCLRAGAVREVGLMDERFFLYFEDVDWARRFWTAGWRVTYVPVATFAHFYQQSSRRHSALGIITNWTTREHIRSAVKYFVKYRGKAAPNPAARPVVA